MRLRTLRAVSTSSTSTEFVGIRTISFDSTAGPATWMASITAAITCGSQVTSQRSPLSFTSSAPASRAISSRRSSLHDACGTRTNPFRRKR